MVADGAAVRKLLVFNARAGSAAGVGERLRRALPEHAVLEMAEGEDLAETLAGCRLAPDAEVVVAGGDGTVGAAVRCLAGTGRVLGLIPVGTFNNFARGLGIPTDVERAIEVVAHGRPAWVGLGRAAGRPFVEAAGVGFFGEALLAGEAAKELRAGELIEHLRHLAGRRPFRYRLTGDLTASGRATSIVVANTPTVGASIEVGSVTPAIPELELAVISPPGRLSGAVRLMVGVVRRQVRAVSSPRRIREVRLETDPPTPVFADTFEVGETPTLFESIPRGVKVLLPA